MLAGVGLDTVRNFSGAATGSLIAAAWQGALLAGAAALGLRMLPKTPAAVRFAIWFSVFVAVAALPFAGAWTHLAAEGVNPAATRSPWLTLDDRWSEGVLALWGAMSLVRLVTLFVGAVRVRSLWRRATPIEVAGVTGERAIYKDAGRTIQICTSNEVDRPSVIGFMAPKILIPGWLMEKLTPEEMTHVVMHEVGHLRRADDWLNLLQKIALVVFPLNPALAWVERRLCFERELACDERVLNATGSPKAYALCLTSLAEHRMTRRGMALVMGVLGRESELGQRVRRILARGEHMRPAQARLVMGGAICAVLAGAAGLEHCPELVGFSAPQETIVATAPANAPLRREDVVYRPEARGSMQARAVNTVLRQPIVQKQTGAVNAPGPVERRNPGQGTEPAQRLSARRVSFTETTAVRPEPAYGAVATEWVVMTSWTATNADGGARIVMTSLATGPAAQPSPDRTGPVREEAGDAVVVAPARAISALQHGGLLPSSSPYAAVPMRGGWLVIQL